MRNKIRSCWLMILLLLLIPLVSLGEAQPAQHRVVRVAFPYQTGMAYETADHCYTGYNYDYLMKLAQFTGWKYEWITFPELSADEALMKSLQMLQNGEADLLGGVLYSPELAEMFEYPRLSYGIAYTRLCVNESNYLLDESTLQLQPCLKVALLENAASRNAETIEFLDDANVTYEILYVENQQQQQQAVLDGEADALACVDLEQMPGLRSVAEYASRPFYFISTKGNTDLTGELDDALARLGNTFPNFRSTLSRQYFQSAAGGFYISSYEQDFVNKGMELKALCLTDAAPFAFRDDGGQPAGIAVSLLKDFAEQLGFTVSISFYDPAVPFAQALEQDDYSCILGIPLNESYNFELGLITSVPYITADVALFGKTLPDISSLQKKTVALQRASSVAEKLDCKAILYYDSLPECIQAVLHGQADCGIGNLNVFNYYRQQMGAVLISSPIANLEQHMEISLPSAADPTLIRLLNRYLYTLEEQKLYQYMDQANATIHQDPFLAVLREKPMETLSILILFLLLMVFVPVSWLHRRNQERYTRQLQLANSAKTDFFSRMSHDLRTPMNAVLGFARLAQDEADNPAQVKDYLSKIESSGEYLLRLINDVLDISKIESGKIELHEELVSGPEFLQSIVTDFQGEAKRCGVALKTDFTQAATPWIYLDKLRSRQIYSNLLSNALKYSDPGSAIEWIIKDTPIDSHTIDVECVIRDHGCGMSPEFLEHLFEPFEREKNSYTFSRQGSGLGLAIVKSLVEKMGGSIAVQSVQGQGSCFTFHFKRRIADHGPDEQAAVSDAAYNRLAGRRILLCEDHPLNREIAQKLLSKKGMQVDTAVNGQLGVQQFASSAPNTYDAVLMDIRMPVMDGLEAAKAIRALPRPDATLVPIIAMTANAFDTDVQASLDAGMNAHLAKPIEPQQLFATLSGFMH